MAISIRLEADKYVVFRIRICDGAQIDDGFRAIVKEAALKCKRHRGNSTDSLLLPTFDFIGDPLCFGDRERSRLSLGGTRTEVCTDANDGQHYHCARYHAKVSELPEQTLPKVLDAHDGKIVDVNERLDRVVSVNSPISMALWAVTSPLCCAVTHASKPNM